MKLKSLLALLGALAAGFVYSTQAVAGPGIVMAHDSVPTSVRVDVIRTDVIGTDVIRRNGASAGPGIV